MIVFGEPRGWWLAGLLIVFFLALANKLRRREAKITTFFILRRMAERLVALDRRIRLLRRLALFLLAAAAVVVVAAALDPFLPTDREPLKSLVIIDLSPTLGQSDDGVPRIERLKGLIGDYLDRLRRDDVVRIITAPGKAESYPPLSPGSAAALLVRGLEWEDVLADVDGALALARVVAYQEHVGEVVVFTDRPGRWNWPGFMAAFGDVKPVFITCGTSQANGGITAFDLERDFFRPEYYDLLVRFAWHRPDQSTTPEGLSVKIINNGREVAQRAGEAVPERGGEMLFKGVRLEPGEVAARLEPGGGYAGDDTVRAAVAGDERVKVYLMGGGEEFTRKALAANSSVDLTVLKHGEQLPRDSRAVYVFEGEVPEGDLPYRSLFIQPGGQVGGLSSQTLLAGAGRIEWDRSHPVLRGVDFEDLGPRGFLAFDESPAFESPATLEGYPLLLLSREQGRRWAIVAFDPVGSRFVYAPSFPILMANLVHWLSLLTAGERTWFATDEVVYLPDTARGGKVTLPVGRSVFLPAGQGGLAFAEGNWAGRYRVASREGRPLGDFFINVTDPAVTAEAALPGFGLGGGALPPDHTAGHAKVDLAPWLVLLALIILLVDSSLTFMQRSGLEVGG